MKFYNGFLSFHLFIYGSFRTLKMGQNKIRYNFLKISGFHKRNLSCLYIKDTSEEKIQVRDQKVIYFIESRAFGSLTYFQNFASYFQYRRVLNLILMKGLEGSEKKTHIYLLFSIVWMDVFFLADLWLNFFVATV